MKTGAVQATRKLTENNGNTKSQFDLFSTWQATLKTLLLRVQELTWLFTCGPEDVALTIIPVGDVRDVDVDPVLNTLRGTVIEPPGTPPASDIYNQKKKIS